jgi:hypothetical protein
MATAAASTLLLNDTRPTTHGHRPNIQGHEEHYEHEEITSNNL